MRKARLSIFFVFAFMAGTQAANADMKIAYVDYDQAIKEEKKAQEYIKDLEKQEAAIAAWEQKVKNEIEPKMKAFQDSMAKWSEEKRKKEEATLTREIGDLQKLSTEKRQKLAADQEAKLNELKTENAELVKVLASKKGYDVVLNAAAMVWVSEKMKKEHDLTRALVEEYNKKNPVSLPKNIVKPAEPKSKGG